MRVWAKRSQSQSLPPRRLDTRSGHLACLIGFLLLVQDIIAKYERLMDNLQMANRDIASLRDNLKETERVSQNAHDLLNRTANELTQVSTAHT